MTIVAMVEKQINDSSKLMDDGVVEARLNETTLVSRPEILYGPKYNWSSDDVGSIQGAFFYSYVIFQIPAARLTEIVGAKWVMAVAGIGSAILSMLSPFAADWHQYAFRAVRFTMGVCQTAVFPAGYILYTKWLPPTERSQALPILYVGAYVGSIISYSGAGFLCRMEPGWPMVFYLSGTICAIWSIVWMVLAASEPRSHRFISTKELEYIESNMERLAGDDPTKQTVSARKDPSWYKILTNVPVWAMIGGFFASNWAFSIVMLYLPTYLNDVQDIPMAMNGLINSLLFALFCVTSPIAGSLSTYMIQTRAFGLNRLQIRKMFEGIALYGQAVPFLLLPIIGKQQNLVLALLFVQMAIYSMINGGEVQIPAELTLDFAGTIYALANCFGSATGFIVPATHGHIVSITRDQAEWDKFWYIASSITALGATVFIVFGKNTIQDLEKTQRKEKQLDTMIDLKQQSQSQQANNTVLTIT